METFELYILAVRERLGKNLARLSAIQYAKRANRKRGPKAWGSMSNVSILGRVSRAVELEIEEDQLILALLGDGTFADILEE